MVISIPAILGGGQLGEIWKRGQWKLKLGQFLLNDDIYEVGAIKEKNIRKIRQKS